MFHRREWHYSLLGFLARPRVILLLFVVFAIVGFFASWAVYGDWRCAFAECRIVKVEP